MKFNELNLSADLLAEIEKAGFVEASPIQEQTIPLALEGKDVIGQAQTGTGKTAAFGLPTLEKIRTEEATIQALVVVRESKSVQYMADQALKNKLRLLNLVPISWWELQVASWT